MMTQSSVAPALTTAEIEELLDLGRRADQYGIAPDYHDDWAASTVYAQGAVVVPPTRNGHYYTVTVAGTSGAAQPTWPTTAGATVVNGTVTFQQSGTTSWEPTYALNAAAAEGYRWKAAKLAAEFDVAVGAGTSFKRSQKYQQLMDLARTYARKGGLVSVPMGAGTYS